MSENFLSHITKFLVRKFPTKSHRANLWAPLKTFVVYVGCWILYMDNGNGDSELEWDAWYENTRFKIWDTGYAIWDMKCDRYGIYNVQRGIIDHKCIECGIQNMWCGMWEARKIWSMEHKCKILDANNGIWSVKWEMGYWLCDIEYRMWNKRWDVGYGIWDVEYRMWDIRFGIRDTIYRMRNVECRVWNIEIYMKYMICKIQDVKYEI